MLNECTYLPTVRREIESMCVNIFGLNVLVFYENEGRPCP